MSVAVFKPELWSRTILNELDVKIKTGKIEQSIGLELFLLD